MSSQVNMINRALSQVCDKICHQHICDKICHQHIKICHQHICWWQILSQGCVGDKSYHKALLIRDDDSSYMEEEFNQVKQSQFPAIFEGQSQVPVKATKGDP